MFITMISCSDNITDMNEDIINPQSTKPQYLFTNAEKALVDQMVNPGIYNNVFRLFAQQWSETQWIFESQYNTTFGKISDVHFSILNRDVIANLKQSRNLLDLETAVTPTEIATLKNKKAIIDILIAYSFSQMVDTYGDIPYSEAQDITNFPLPKYDDAQTIYRDLILKLTNASNVLKDGGTSFGDADLVYQGNVLKWRKFANSLKLRMSLNMADINAVDAKKWTTEAIAGGVISGNDENFNLNYLSLQPNANPLYGLANSSYKDYFIPSNTLVDKMNDLADPRRSKFYTTAPDGTYKGGIYGETNLFSSFSHVTPTISEPTFPGTLFDYSETEFLLAEAAARTFITDNPETHYVKAISASMANWGITDATVISAYLAQPKVAYATATGTWEQKIGEQAWIALYNRGFEGWTSYRRLDFPALKPPAKTYLNINTVPKRYMYPGIEETLNTKNNTAASVAIGGNSMATKVFWDKK